MVIGDGCGLLRYMGCLDRGGVVPLLLLFSIGGKKWGSVWKQSYTQEASFYLVTCVWCWLGGFMKLHLYGCCWCPKMLVGIQS